MVPPTLAQIRDPPSSRPLCGWSDLQTFFVGTKKKKKRKALCFHTTSQSVKFGLKSVLGRKKKCFLHLCCHKKEKDHQVLRVELAKTKHALTHLHQHIYKQFIHLHCLTAVCSLFEVETPKSVRKRISEYGTKYCRSRKN